MAKLTLEEARKIYKKSDSLKALMLTKFSKEELERNEVTQEESDKAFLELLSQCAKTVFLTPDGYKSEIPTNRIELQNCDGYWMFDIQFTGKQHFWFNFDLIWYNNAKWIKSIGSMVKIRFGMNDCTPEYKTTEI